MGKEKDHKPEIIMYYNATKSGVNILDKPVRECACTRSTRHWPLKLFLTLIDVACVNAFVPWMLKYPNWQQKNNQRCLYLLSVEVEMVTPHLRRRTDSGNINGHTCRTVRVMGVTCKQTATPTAVKKSGGQWRGRCSVCPSAKDRKTDWKCCQCSEWVCKEHSIKTIQITCDNCKEQSY